MSQHRFLPALLLFLCLLPCPSVAATQLGEIDVEVLNIEQMADDGYWDWYLRHNEEVRTFQQGLTETRMQLVHLASEISRAKAAGFNLEKMHLQWQMINNETIHFGGFDLGNYFQSAIHETAKVGPQAIASNRKKKQELEDEIRQYGQWQKDLIDKTIQQQAEIFSRAQAQHKKSGEKRPALTAEILRLADERKLLPLFLYDYAALNAPDQLPRVIKELMEKEPVDKQLANLLLAKAKIADAENLEKEAFLEKLKPTLTNKQRLLFLRATIKGDPLGYLAGRTGVNAILKEVTIADVLQTTSQTQRLDAIALLRELLRTGQNSVAKAMLVQQEIYWVKRIAQKLEGQSEMALSAFSAYLSSRGFDPVDRIGWLPWMKDYAGAVWGLGPISMFAGIPGINLPGANAELVGAQMLDAARDRIALVGILKLLKAGYSLTELKARSPRELNQQLQKIWGDDAKSTSKRSDSVKRLAVDIHTCLRDLRDLDRLSTDDRFEFARDVNEYFAKNYFTPVDSGYQSFEWFGDLLNVHNLVTFWGPGAIAKIDGKWALTPYMSFAQQDLLQKAGLNLASLSRAAAIDLLNSEKILIRGYNLDTIGEMIRKTRTVQLLAKANAPLESVAKLTGSLANFKSAALLGSAGRLAVDSSKLAANFFLNYAVTEFAASSGIPGAALATELLMSYEVPQGAIENYLFTAPAAQLKGMAAPLKRYQRQVETTQRLIAETSTSVDEAAELLALAGKETASPPLPETPASQLNRQIDDLGESLQGQRMEQTTRVAEELGVPQAVTAQAPTGRQPTRLAPADPRVTPLASPGNRATRMAPENIPQATAAAAEDALLSGVNALRAGDVEEAGRAIGAARTLAKTAQKDADYVADRIAAAIDRVDNFSAPPQTHQVNALSDELAELVTVPTGDRTTVTPLFDPEVYQQGVVGEKIRLADGALRRDDFDAALAHLDEAKSYGGELGETNGRLELEIERRETLLAHARDAKGFILQRRGESHPSPARAEIQEADLDAILDKLKNGEFESTTSGMNPAIEVTIGANKFRLKPAQAADKAEAEVVGGALAELLGFDTPGAKIMDAGGIEVIIPAKTRVNPQGDTIINPAQKVVVGKVLVTRSIDQFVPLLDMEEHVLLALRADYAEQRALRAFLADSDGHLNNIGIGPNGKFWVIDTDMANFGSDHSLKQLGSTPFRSEGELVEAAVTFAHGVMPANLRTNATMAGADHLAKAIKPHPLYRWINRIDQMVRYEDMAALVGRIKKLVSSESTVVERLVAGGVDRSRAQQIFQLLQQRAEILEEVLNKPSLFGGDPVRFSFQQKYQRPPSRPRVAARSTERRWAACG